jgi:hypothetical protein
MTMICDPNNGQWQVVIGEQYRRLLAALDRLTAALEQRRTNHGE